VRVAAWRVQDTGLVAAPGPFRRLAGSRVRHLRGDGPVWPVQVVLDLDGDVLRAVDASGDGAVVGTWPRGEVRVRRVAAGPPVQFVLELAGQAQLLAAAAEPDTEAFLAALPPVLG
jgi:hypothetical protein